MPISCAIVSTENPYAAALHISLIVSLVIFILLCFTLRALRAKIERYHGGENRLKLPRRNRPAPCQRAENARQREGHKRFYVDKFC